MKNDDPLGKVDKLGLCNLHIADSCHCSDESFKEYVELPAVRKVLVEWLEKYKCQYHDDGCNKSDCAAAALERGSRE